MTLPGTVLPGDSLLGLRSRGMGGVAVCLTINAKFPPAVAGHWASIMSVNTHDPYNMVTMTIIDFIDSIIQPKDTK